MGSEMCIRDSKCAEIGSLMASEVITSFGPRIEKDPKKIVEHLL